MILDIEKVSLKTIAEMLVNAAHALEESHPVSDAERSVLNTLAF
jgi:hypothetical protein